MKILKFLLMIRFLFYGIIFSSIFNVIVSILGISLTGNYYLMISIPLLILMLPLIMYFDNKYVVKKLNK